MRSSIVLFVSLLALFFACQMSRGAEQASVWSADTALVEDAPVFQMGADLLRP